MDMTSAKSAVPVNAMSSSWMMDPAAQTLGWGGRVADRSDFFPP